MQLINSKVEIIPQEPGLLGVYKQIELAGRTAYKSEDKITDDSAKAFVDMLISRGHTAPLEHGTVYLRGIAVRKDYMSYHIDDYKNNPYSRVYLVRDLDDPDVIEFYITSNFRVLYENNWLNDLHYLSEPTKFHEKRITARFICSRGISHELVRHRTFSFVQESTRYCNYSKNKYDNQLTFIKSTWVDIPTGIYTELTYNPNIDRTLIKLNGEVYRFDETPFKESCAIDPKYFNFVEPLYYAEQNYLVGLNRGFKPQDMRDVLPNALKTEVVMTGFESDWKHFFELRCAPSAHPDMQKLANELREKMSDAAK